MVTNVETMFAETPSELVPKMGEFPVSNAAYYRQLILTDPATVSLGDDVNGYNVARVEFGRLNGEPLGTYRQVSETDWQEQVGGRAGFSFVEQNRDEWSVYLRDESRNVRLQLDLHRRVIVYSDAENTFDLYSIQSGDTGDNRRLEEDVDPFAWNNDLPDTPATGVLLTFEQGWYQKGLALGELRKSVCLAPGEVTKLAVVDWRREERSRESSAAQQRERVSATLDDTMSAVKVQKAVQSEAAHGLAVTSGFAHQRQSSAGFSLGFVGASTSHSSSLRMGMSASSNTGRRDVASSATKSVERRTEQLAQSQRSARATQIRDASESEDQTTTTRVVANYNHAHALTMQYFEVLQVYSIETKVVRAERCVFIPMEPFEFTQEALLAADDEVIELLRLVLRDLGEYQLEEMVASIHVKAPSLEASIADAKTQLTAARARLAQIEAQLAHLAQVAQHFWGPLWVAQHTLTTARNAAQAEIAALEDTIAQKELAQRDHRRLFGLLDQHRVMLNQQMWMRIDDHKWHRLLADKTYPSAPYKGQPIGGLVDPKPIGFFGTYMAFKWDFPSRTADGVDPLSLIDADEFEAMYVNDAGVTETQIVLPSEGVFAEAVLGQANSAEKIDITRFWNWQDSPIPVLPPEMAQVDTGSRARDVELPSRLDLGPAIALLRDAGVLPDIDNAEILKALQISVAGSGAQLVAAAGQAGTDSAKAASEGAGQSAQHTVDGIANMQEMVVGLANSAVVSTITDSIGGGSGSGATATGGLMNASRRARTVIARRSSGKGSSGSGSSGSGSSGSGSGSGSGSAGGAAGGDGSSSGESGSGGEGRSPPGAGSPETGRVATGRPPVKVTPNRTIDLTPERSGMPTAHARQIAEFCREHDLFVFVRPSEMETMELIDAGFATKSMDIHDKSSNWGPMAGAVPLDRAFSKKVAEHQIPQTLEDPAAMFRRIRQVGEDAAGHSNAQIGIEKPIQLIISDDVRLQWFRQGKMTIARGWRSAIPKMYYHGVAHDSQGRPIVNDVTANTLFMLEHVEVPREVLDAWDVSERKNEYWKVSWATLQPGGDRTELEHYSKMQPLFVWGYPIDELQQQWHGSDDLFSWEHEGETYAYPWRHYRAVTGDYDLWMVAPHMAWWKLNMHVVQFVDEHNVASSATFFTNWLNNQLNEVCGRATNPVFNHGAEEQNYGFTQALDKELVMFTSSGGARMVDMQADMPRIMVELMCSGYLTLWNKRYDEIDPELSHRVAPDEDLALIEAVKTAGRHLGELTDSLDAADGDVSSADIAEAREAFAVAAARLRASNVDLADVSVWSHRFRAELSQAAKQPGEHVGFEKLTRADINQRNRRYPLPKIDGEANYWTAPEDVFGIQLLLQERLVDATMGGGYSELDGLEDFFSNNVEALWILSNRIRQAPGTDDMRGDAFIPARATAVDTFEIKL